MELKADPENAGNDTLRKSPAFQLLRGSLRLRLFRHLHMKFSG